MTTTYIIGHRKPDTDSVVAAMALEYLYQQKKCFGYDLPQAVITTTLNPETSYLFNKFGVKTPRLITADDIKKDDQVVLVDHNEESQRLTALNPDQIVDIIDHHKINLNLSKPVDATFKTWGSSSTIVYSLMEQQDVKPDKTLASLLLAAILSDTVGLKSATSADKDKDYVQKLAKIAEINDVDAFTLEIFKAKSDISQLSDKEIVTNDYKIFEFGQKTLISQLETVQQDEILKNKKDDLLAALAAIKTEQGVELIFCAITDILKINTKLLLLGDEEQAVAQKAFGGGVEDHVLDIGPKMSRKKEMAPAIEKSLE